MSQTFKKQMNTVIREIEYNQAKLLTFYEEK